MQSRGVCHGLVCALIVAGNVALEAKFALSPEKNPLFTSGPKPVVHGPNVAGHHMGTNTDASPLDDLIAPIFLTSGSPRATRPFPCRVGTE